MASKCNQFQDDKQPVMSSGFRMVVERMVAKFVDAPSETLEFPASLNKDQRDFVENFVYKAFGLKSKLVGRGNNLRIVAFKCNENLFNASNSLIELSPQSMKLVQKIVELLSDSPTVPILKSPAIDSDKKLPIKLVSIGSVSHNRNTSITVPPKSFNPQCAEAREKLPIFKHRREIIEMINLSQVSIIESTTGSGKSTQVPQYILEHASANNLPCRVIVAEPKRLCATTLADRVSFERGEMLGGTVGYQIRLQSQVAPNSNLIYVTNGVILRMLMSGKPEEFFQSITTLIIDEVHERDKFSDFLLLCVRENLKLHKNLKVVIMSATVDTEIFSQYFGGCPVFKLEGRSFEVKECFLEDVLRLVNFTNNQVKDLYKSCNNNPELFNPPVKSQSDAENLDDDTKDTVNEILDKMSNSRDCDLEFHRFLYMVQAEGVPVDIRHKMTNRTALTFAVEYGLAADIEKLLKLKADPLFKFEVDGREMTALEMAKEKKASKVVTILQNHLAVVQSNVSTPADVIETSMFNRMVLDIYYDTLVLPGVNRGVFLEDIVDLSLIVHLIRHIHFNTHTCNGILVFLPGHDEIVQLANLVCNALDMNYNIFILHSQMHTSDQTRVFDPTPFGIRKIIFATNIAESSITVNDVVYVIDSGKEKQKTFNAVTHVSCLRPQWISKASAKQRAGRAGRLCKGMVFRMYSRDRFNHLLDNAKPEFLRCDLTDICLQVKMIAKSDESIADFLKKALTPPTDVTVQHSLKILQQLGALTYDETLTQLGLYIADIPLSAKYGKMLIHAILLKCIDPVLTIVSILSINEPFTLPSRIEERDRCHRLKLKLEEGSFSDHFVMLRIFQKWNEYKTTNEFDVGFCEDNFVNSGTMERIASTRVKIVGYLRSVRLIQSVGNIAALNENSNSWSTIKACIAAGSYPEIARALKKQGDIVTAYDKKLIINPSSVLRPNFNSKLGKEHVSHFPAEWIVFEEKNLAGNLGMAKTCTIISNITVALTAGLGLSVNDERWSDDGHKDEENSKVELEVDGFIKFSVDSAVAYNLLEIRGQFGDLMEKYLMDVEKFCFKENDEVLIEGVVKLLELEDEKAGFKIQHDGIGSRPRIITRDFNAPKEWRSIKASVAVTPNAMLTMEMIPPSSQQLKPTQELEACNLKTVQRSTMRYFTVKMESDEVVEQLKASVTVLMESEGKLPADFLDALIEMEVNDRVSKKTILFYSNTQIVGVGMLMDCPDQQIKRENLKMFFQSDQKFDLSMLKQFVANEQQFAKLFAKPFAEVSPEIGKFCVGFCSNKIADNSSQKK